MSKFPDLTRKVVMALFEKTVTISAERVAEIVSTEWGVTLGPIIKASQNHTFSGTRSGGEKCIVRVTPDPTGKHHERIVKEIFFVNYIIAKGVYHVSPPIKHRGDDFVIRADDLVVVVFEFAKGEPIDFMSYRWMDQDIVTAWGRWMGQLHVASRSFTVDHPEVASTIQRYDQIHQGILAEAPIHPDDQQHDPSTWGVIHGDVNPSNFFFIPEENTLSVFDWDQTQQGWYLWDLAQSSFTVVMLAEAGSVVDGSPVPQANPAQFQAWLFEGYEEATGERVNVDQFHRMIALRKYFYETFCRKAKEQGDLPKDMEHFINYIVAWFDKDKAKAVEKQTE